MIATPTHSQIEFVGVLVRGFTFDQNFEPGRALSRENAKLMREFAVTDAMPQKNCAPHTMNSRNLASVGLLRASRKICAGARPVDVAASLLRPSLVPFWMASVIEYSRIHPPMIEITTLMII